MVVLFLLLCFLLGLTLNCGLVVSVLVLGLECFIVVDWARILFLFTLLSLSSSVLVWSFYYMDSTCDFPSFIKLLLVFLFSILGLVVSGNLLTLFFFWDLLGFTSFFLVL
jgi:NADH:ubiquinone oxidoreductase subunit 5 (subunit L)/multisubunit Na+/H+ antiporter MnhA subunit